MNDPALSPGGGELRGRLRGYGSSEEHVRARPEARGEKLFEGKGIEEGRFDSAKEENDEKEGPSQIARPTGEKPLKPSTVAP